MILDERPEENDVGLARVISEYEGQFMEIFMFGFEESGPDMDGGLAQDVLVDGTRMTPGEKQHPTVFAGIAGWGHATLQIGALPYPDPVTGAGLLKAAMFVTPNGFRDNETGAVYDEDGNIWTPGAVPELGQNDWEVHMRVQSPPGNRQPDWVYAPSRPGTGATDLFTPTEGYAEVFLFDNARFGGEMTVDMSFETVDPVGTNVLDVTLRDPKGITLDTWQLVPGLNAPATHQVTVPLQHFGKYSLDVQGEVSLSRYDVSITQHTPDDFDMTFWWDEATFGRSSTPTLRSCEDEVGRPEELVATIVDQQIPPPFQWVPIGFGLATVAIGIVLMGKLIHMSATRD